MGWVAGLGDLVEVAPDEIGEVPGYHGKDDEVD